MDPDWADVFPIKHGDVIPASYVRLPEGSWKVVPFVFPTDPKNPKTPQSNGKFEYPKTSLHRFLFPFRRIQLLIVSLKVGCFSKESIFSGVFVGS